MDRWKGRVALVTGASSGIGAAIAKELVQHGLKVVGCARRVERIENFAKELKDQPGKLYPLKCDVTKEEDILAAFQWVKTNLGGVDICINNAGYLCTQDSLIDGKTDEWKRTLDVNVLGPSICSREALKSMKERNVDDGHIIHISSVGGHYILSFAAGHFYTGSKHALRALTEGLRQELAASKSKIRVTAISPGAVETEMFDSFMRTANEEQKETFKNMPVMESKDISDAVIYVLSAPPRVQVHDIIIRPACDPF